MFHIPVSRNTDVSDNGNDNILPHFTCSAEISANLNLLQISSNGLHYLLISNPITQISS
jgi:hypothetical protein